MPQSIGIALALCGNVLVSVSLNMQKHVHNILSAEVQSEDSNKSVTGATSNSKYLKYPMWWVGLVLMLIGEVGNFVAFGFAPTSVVSPLGATTVVANAIIATKMLKEPFGRTDLAGIILTIIGGVTFLTFAPSPSESEVRLDVSQLKIRFLSFDFIAFVILIVSLTGGVYYFSRVRHGYYARRHVWIYVLVCSLLGSVTVVCLKAFSGLIQLDVTGKNQFWTVGPQGFIPYALMLLVASTGVMQIRFLQMAMEAFGSSQVVPVYYILFTLCTMAGGAFVYKEFSYFDAPYDPPLFFFGFCFIILGVVIISSKGKRLSWAPCLYSEIGEERTALRRRSVSRRASHSLQEKAAGTELHSAPTVEDDVYVA